MKVQCYKHVDMEELVRVMNQHNEKHYWSEQGFDSSTYFDHNLCENDTSYAFVIPSVEEKEEILSGESDNDYCDFLIAAWWVLEDIAGCEINEKVYLDICW